MSEKAKLKKALSLGVKAHSRQEYEDDEDDEDDEDCEGHEKDEKDEDTNSDNDMDILQAQLQHLGIGDDGMEAIQKLLQLLKTGNSTAERVLALDALTKMAITCDSKDFSDDSALYRRIHGPVQTVWERVDDEKVKVHAIRALATIFVFSSQSRELGEELLEFLVEIIESDGNTVDALNSREVVVAAMQAWTFVADVWVDMGGDARRAMKAFHDQLDSRYPDVTYTAALQIAYLFDVQRNPDDAEAQQLYLPYTLEMLRPRLIVASRGTKAFSKGGRRQAAGLWLRRVIGYLDDNLPLEYSTVWRKRDDEGQYILKIDTLGPWMLKEYLHTSLGKGFEAHWFDNDKIALLLGEASLEVLKKPKRRKKSRAERNGGALPRPSEIRLLADDEASD